MTWQRSVYSAPPPVRELETAARIGGGWNGTSCDGGATGGGSAGGVREHRHDS